MSRNTKKILSLLSLALLSIHIGCLRGKDSTENNGDPGVSSKASPQSEQNSTPLPNDRDNQVVSGGLADPPVLVTKVTRKNGKPPLQIYSLDTEFAAERDGYKWILTPFYGDKPLVASGVFTNNENPNTNINGYEYNVAAGKVVIIQFLGNEKFRAIRTPTRGAVRFNSYTIFSDAEISGFEVWEVQSLLVNGKTPLEEWLPFDTASNATDHSINDQDYDNRILRFETDMNANTNGTYLAKEKVEFITARGIRKWIVPFKLDDSH